MSRDKGEGRSARRHLTLRSRLSADRFVKIDEQLQSGLLPQSVMQSGAARGPSAEQWTSRLTTGRPQTRGRHPDTGRVTSRAVHRRPASRRRLSRRRSYWKRTVHLAGTRYTMCCSFRTAPTAFTWTSRRTARRRLLRILLLAIDEARRPCLNVVLYGDRLFQQYVVDSCAKMEQQRLNYLRFNQNSLELTLSGEWQRSRQSLSAQFYA